MAAGFEAWYSQAFDDEKWLRFTTMLMESTPEKHAKIDAVLHGPPPRHVEGFPPWPSREDLRAWAEKEHRRVTDSYEQAVLGAWISMRPNGIRDGECYPGEVWRISAKMNPPPAPAKESDDVP